jgi:hypothetical protein
MNLSMEESGVIDPITSDSLREALGDDSFGKFAILSRSEDDFIQAGNNWDPSEECGRFLKETGSDPWILEYREGQKVRRARGNRTLDEVIAVFIEYLEGKEEWRTRFWWVEQKVK